MAKAQSRSRAEARFGEECRPDPHLKMGANKSLLKQAESGPPVSFPGNDHCVNLMYEIQ